MYLLRQSLLVELVSLVDEEYEELVSAVGGEDLQSTATQEIETLVDLPDDSVRPLHTAATYGDHNIRVYSGTPLIRTLLGQKKVS